MIRARQS